MPRREYQAKGFRLTVDIPEAFRRQVMTHPATRAELGHVLDEIASKAQARVPVNTGKLKASEKHGVLVTSEGLIGIVGYAMFYAHMVHNGTAHSHPNPWLLNATLEVLASGRRSRASVTSAAA